MNAKFCGECAKPLTEPGELDGFNLCHACYCVVMDNTRSEYAEQRAYYKQQLEATKEGQECN